MADQMAAQIDDMLEEFLGIRDSELARTVHDLALANANAGAGASALTTTLGDKLADFEFPAGFARGVHAIISPDNGAGVLYATLACPYAHRAVLALALRPCPRIVVDPAVPTKNNLG